MKVGNRYKNLPDGITSHSDYAVMGLVEEYMGRPILLKAPREKFEKVPPGLFSVSKVDAGRVMIGYSLIRI